VCVYGGVVVGVVVVVVFVGVVVVVVFVGC
jgi:hypothetical protein